MSVREIRLSFVYLAAEALPCFAEMKRESLLIGTGERWDILSKWSSAVYKHGWKCACLVFIFDIFYRYIFTAFYPFWKNKNDKIFLCLLNFFFFFVYISSLFSEWCMPGPLWEQLLNKQDFFFIWKHHKKLLGKLYIKN